MASVMNSTMIFSSSAPSPALAIYIHWPFCKSKCPYCDFNSHVVNRIDHDVWRSAYQHEVEYYHRLLPDRHLSSVFFGGGTPSLMDPATVAHILETINNCWPIRSDTEITLEANPTSSDAHKFESFRKAGVNRVSVGIQALNNDDLKFLGREHDADEARAAIEKAATYFPRYSFDLIYARRHQTLQDWEKELCEAIALSRGHLSLYQLTIEPSTLFYTRSQRGEELTAPDDQAASMFEATQTIMIEHGMPAYEISNHAIPGQESRHNLTYWHYDDYIGVGPGAHGRYTDKTRQATDNHRSPEVWLQQVHEKNHGLRQTEALTPETTMREALMMGLRLREGISKETWSHKFGVSIQDFLPLQKIERLKKESLLEWNDQVLQATLTGRQKLNALLHYLLT